MRVAVETSHQGAPGVSFRMSLNGLQIPFGLSLMSARALRDELDAAVKAHEAKAK